MPQDRFAGRIDRLLRRLKGAGVDALLVTSPINVRYLTGFTGEDSYLLVGRNSTVLISDRRFETQISEECPRLEAEIRPPHKTLTEAVGAAVGRAKLTTLGFETATTSYAQWESLTQAVKPLQLAPQAGHVEALRISKDADEIGEIKDAILQAERGFRLFKASLRPKSSGFRMSEREAADGLESAMRRFGARQASFETIVAAGARSALPHARPTATDVSEADFLLVDWGATNAHGYRSDLTRMIVTGNISPKLEKLYGVVLNAQQRAIEKIEPGVAASQVDSAARQVIGHAGLANHFGHGLGHGIGLEIHEAPRVAQNSQVVLKAGMIVTVEPGVYLPGWGGIRIEDDVLVTRGGCEVLTSLPREIESVVLQ